MHHPPKLSIELEACLGTPSCSIHTPTQNISYSSKLHSNSHQTRNWFSPPVCQNLGKSRANGFGFQTSQSIQRFHNQRHIRIRYRLPAPHHASRSLRLPPNTRHVAYHARAVEIPTSDFISNLGSLHLASQACGRGLLRSRIHYNKVAEYMRVSAHGFARLPEADPVAYALPPNTRHLVVPATGSVSVGFRRAYGTRAMVVVSPGARDGSYRDKGGST